MRTLVYSLIALLAISQVEAKAFSVDKTAIVELKAAADALVQIDAKNTETQIEMWDQNKVYVEAQFSYRGEEQNEKIDEFLKEFEKNVKNGIKGTGREFRISTYHSMPSKVKVGWQEFAFFNWTFSADEVQIKYIIKLPKGATMDVKHSYHPLKIVGSVKSLRLEQYSGRLDVDDIEEARFMIKYGKANTGTINRGKIELYEADLQSESYDELKLNARYSNFRAKNIGAFKALAYESEFYLQKVGKLSGEFKYSRLESKEIGSGDLMSYESKLYSNKVEKLNLSNSKYSRYEIADVKDMSIGESYEDKILVDRAHRFKAGESKYQECLIRELVESYSLMGYECKLEIAALGGESGQIKVDGKYLKMSINLDDKVYTINAALKYGKLAYPQSKVKAQLMEEGSNFLGNIESKKKGNQKYVVMLNGYEVKAEIL